MPHNTAVPYTCALSCPLSAFSSNVNVCIMVKSDKTYSVNHIDETWTVTGCKNLWGTFCKITFTQYAELDFRRD